MELFGWLKVPKLGYNPVLDSHDAVQLGVGIFFFFLFYLLVERTSHQLAR